MITSVRNTDWVCGTGVDVSVTINCTRELPTAVGVPLTWPVEEFKLKPAGSKPLTDH